MVTVGQRFNGVDGFAVARSCPGDRVTRSTANRCRSIGREAPSPSTAGRTRQAAFKQAKANHDFLEERELKRNTELTRTVHRLTSELYEHVLGSEADEPVRGAHSRQAPPRDR